MGKNQRNFDTQLNLTKTQFLDQMHTNKKIARSTMWITIREMISKHDDVHMKLRKGEWTAYVNGKESNEEWAKMEAYMGLFEHCYRLLEDDILDYETFKKIYGYRISNILKNSEIKTEKLENRGESWQEFISLCRKIDLGNTLPKQYRDSIKIEKMELDASLQVHKNPILINEE